MYILKMYNTFTDIAKCINDFSYLVWSLSYGINIIIQKYII